MYKYYDPRDMITIIGSFFGEDKYTLNIGSLYHVAQRNPITSNVFTYDDTKEVDPNNIEFKDIIDEHGVIVTKEDIMNGNVRFKQTVPNHHSETLILVIQALIYSWFTKEDKSLCFNDPVGNNNTNLTSNIFSTNKGIDDDINHILKSRYPDSDEVTRNLFAEAFYSHVNDKKLTHILNGQIYNIDDNLYLYKFYNRGTPMEYRYRLLLMQKQKE